jgi:hypothetical protein
MGPSQPSGLPGIELGIDILHLSKEKNSLKKHKTKPINTNAKLRTIIPVGLGGHGALPAQRPPASSEPQAVHVVQLLPTNKGLWMRRKKKGKNDGRSCSCCHTEALPACLLGGGRGRKWMRKKTERKKNHEECYLMRPAAFRAASSPAVAGLAPGGAFLWPSGRQRGIICKISRIELRGLKRQEKRKKGLSQAPYLSQAP